MMKTVLGSLFGILLFAGAAATTAGQSNGSGRLAGTWNVVVQPRVCATGNVITTLQSTNLFLPGGTFSGLSSMGGSGGRGREQLGLWKHVAGNRYRFRFKTYIFDTAGVATYQILTSDLDLDDDALNWSSTGVSQTFTLDGVQINVGCSTIVASRVDAL